MMCYQDRTFCGAKECRHFLQCGSALTVKVQTMAAAQNLPISQYVDPSKLYCYKPTSPTDPDESHP